MNRRNSAEPPTCGAMALSVAMRVGPVRSRRRSVLGIPTMITGRMTPSAVRESTVWTTCGKSSSRPPSGMYSTGYRARDRAYPAGKCTLMGLDSRSARDATLNVSCAGTGSGGGDAACAPTDLHANASSATPRSQDKRRNPEPPPMSTVIMPGCGWRSYSRYPGRRGRPPAVRPRARRQSTHGRSRLREFPVSCKTLRDSSGSNRGPR